MDGCSSRFWAMCAILALAVLAGPIVQDYPSDRPSIIIHLGRDQNSKRIKGEFEYPHIWHIKYSHMILTHYKIEYREDALDKPYYQLGKNAPRQEFEQGSFAAGGLFIYLLAKQIELVVWEDINDYEYRKMRYKPDGQPYKLDYMGRRKNGLYY